MSLVIQNNRSLIFLSFLEPDYSRSGVYFNGIDNANTLFFRIQNSLFGMLSDLIQVRKIQGHSGSSIIVMSPCHKMAIFARLVLSQTIILDAGWSLSESTITHKTGIKSFKKIVRDWLIDLFAFHLATKVVLESEQQVAYVSKRFFISKNKLHFVYTGLNEKNFPSSSPELTSISIGNRLQVLFRGKYNSEAGIDRIAEASLILRDEPIDFVIHTNMPLSGMRFSKNTKIISSHLSNSEMASLYSSVDVCLGQFSDSSRLKRTIPHKAFESLYFSKCYVTPYSKPIESLVGDLSNVLFTNGSDPQDLVEALVKLEKDRGLAKSIGERGHLKYLENLTQKKLAQKFMEISI